MEADMKKRAIESNGKFNPVLNSNAARKVKKETFPSPKHPKSIECNLFLLTKFGMYKYLK